LATILLIEGDQQLRATIAQSLADAGFHVVTASHAALGVRAMYETPPDMVLLDEELPSVNGEELCSYIRRIFDIPIIVLVSSEQGAASAHFLDIGADVCLAKPPSQRLLLARVSSLFWRYGRKLRHNFSHGIDLDCEAHEVNLGDRTIDLTPTEFRLLNCLALNSDRLVPYAELAIGVWGRQGISPGSLKFYLCSLKKKLANGCDSDFDLLNQRGVGFRFVPHRILKGGDFYQEGENKNQKRSHYARGRRTIRQS